MKHIAIVTVEEKEYMVSLDAKSLFDAEHIILDKSYCGKHAYSVESCIAFDTDSIKTDTFVGLALGAKTVSMNELDCIIFERNLVLEEKDKAEDRIHEIEKKMEELAKELEAAKKVLSA